MLKWTPITGPVGGTRQRRSFAMEFQPADGHYGTTDSSTAKRFARLSPVAPLKEAHNGRAFAPVTGSRLRFSG